MTPRDGSDAGLDATRQVAAAAALPMIRPAPRLAGLIDAIAAIERSGVYSNYGPVNSRFEQAVAARLFAGRSGALTACNATLALMLALKRATLGQDRRRRFALMPSFSFAATAQAALWAGLTPLLCDIAVDDWLACPDREAELLARHGDEVAVLLACTTFGNPVDLPRYRALADRYGFRIVVDAAAALGSVDADGVNFGAGAPEPAVFSMHATKAFATSEGGLICSSDPALLADLRAMGNFGFTEPRSAGLPGLNAKMDELTAALALAKLAEFPSVAARRQRAELRYRALLPDFSFQRMACASYAPIFASVLLPRELAPRRSAVRSAMLEEGVQTGAYFDPHMARQPYLADASLAGPLPVTDDLSARIVNLPMSDSISDADVSRASDALRRACRSV
jgi:dTDP-4-amino-4,6-dideoxygalactose transaminase